MQLQKIRNWFGNFKAVGEKKICNRKKAEKKKPWTLRSVVNECYKDLVKENIATIAKEQKFDSEKQHLKFGQLALNRVLDFVNKDSQKLTEALDLIVKWNEGPPKDVKAK